MTVSGKHSQNQNQTQTGLTSDQQFDNKDKDSNQRKVIEDKDIITNSNIKTKINGNSNDNNIIDISLKLIEDTNSLSVNNNKSAQTIESTNNSCFRDTIDSQNIVNHSSGDQQLATITSEDTIIIEDDMNHVTQNDKQLRPNETQQDEEMMDTAMDDNNALKNDGIFSFI